MAAFRDARFRQKIVAFGRKRVYRPAGGLASPDDDVMMAAMRQEGP
jgi:hypothetical protein